MFTYVACEFPILYSSVYGSNNSDQASQFKNNIIIILDSQK